MIPRPAWVLVPLVLAVFLVVACSTVVAHAGERSAGGCGIERADALRLGPSAALAGPPDSYEHLPLLTPGRWPGPGDPGQAAIAATPREPQAPRAPPLLPLFTA